MRSMSPAPLLLLLAALGLVACDDGGEDPGPGDTSTQDTAEGDADTTMPPEDTAQDTEPDVVDTVDPALNAPLRVALVYRDLLASDPASLYLIDDVAGSQELRLSDLTELTTGIDCHSGRCSVTSDLGWLVYLSGTGALQVAEIGSDLQVGAAELQTMAASTTQVVVAGTRVAYVAENQAWYEDLGDGLHQPRSLTEVVADVGDGFEYTDGGIALDARGSAMLVYRYDLSSLAMFRVPLDGGEATLLHRYGMPRGAGSTFTGDNPVAVTQDGSSAVVLLEGTIRYETCSSNQDCQSVQDGTCAYYTDEGGVQSSLGVCITQQRTLQGFALEASDLGQACTDDSGCDPRHQCVVDPTTLIGGNPERVCAPRQHVLGPRGVDVCNGLQEGHFASVLKKLRMTPDDRVVYLGINDCDELNVPNNAIVAIDASLDPASVTLLEGPYDHDHGAGFCYDETEDRWDYPMCTIELQDFDLGPQGGLIVRGSGASERVGRELWAWDAEGRRYPLTSDVFNDVTLHFAIAP